MAEKKYIISIDCGTQSSRAVVWDLKGDFISGGKVKLDIINPCPGCYEQDAKTWWSATCLAIRQAIKQIDVQDISTVGVTHQRETFVPISPEGKPLRNALLYMDKRCLDQIEMVKRKIGTRKVHEITGKVPSYVPSLYHILWLIDNEPQVCDKVFKYLDVGAYLLMHLIGRYITSYVSADATSLINIKTGTWDSDLMSSLGLKKEQFLELCPPGRIIGNITEKAAKETGLPEGLPVVSGAGDGICAALGANVLSEDRLFLVIGTFTALGAYTSKYIIDESFRTLCSCIPGSYNLESNMVGGYIISWFIKNFKTKDSQSDKEEFWEKVVAKIPPGSEGLVTVPYWTGTLAPFWDPLARGLTVGWSGIHTKGHFYRSILEGIAFEHKLLAEKMSSALNTNFKDVVFVGGGAKSSLWSQIISDVLGIPISVSTAVESTALGAAILAASGMGFYSSIEDASNSMTEIKKKYEPNEKKTAFYETLYDRVYKPLFPQIQNLIDTLGKIV